MVLFTNQDSQETDGCLKRGITHQGSAPLIKIELVLSNEYSCRNNGIRDFDLYLLPL